MYANVSIMHDTDCARLFRQGLHWQDPGWTPEPRNEESVGIPRQWGFMIDRETMICTEPGSPKRDQAKVRNSKSGLALFYVLNTMSVLPPGCAFCRL